MQYPESLATTPSAESHSTYKDLRAIAAPFRRTHAPGHSPPTGSCLSLLFESPVQVARSRVVEHHEEVFSRPEHSLLKLDVSQAPR